MKTILVPLDGSAVAAEIVPSVRTLARLLDAHVHLLHVISDQEVETLIAVDAGVLREAGAAEMPAAQREVYVREMLCQHAQADLEALAVRLRDDGLYVDAESVGGVPAATIVAVAEHLQADLIAMATHGYAGVKRLTLGSVTDKVAHATRLPVFIVPGGRAARAAEQRLRRIVVPLDGSSFARQALPLAAEWAARAAAELVLFQAVAPTIEVYQGIQLPEPVQEALRQQAENELHALASELHHYDVPVAIEVVSGYAAEAIVAATERHHADLIIMATHGYSGLKRWALGSVADRVLHTSTTPLVLVHAGSPAG